MTKPNHFIRITEGTSTVDTSVAIVTVGGLKYEVMQPVDKSGHFLYDPTDVYSFCNHPTGTGGLNSATSIARIGIINGAGTGKNVDILGMYYSLAATSSGVAAVGNRWRVHYCTNLTTGLATSVEPIRLDTTTTAVVPTSIDTYATPAGTGLTAVGIVEPPIFGGIMSGTVTGRNGGRNWIFNCLSDGGLPIVLSAGTGLFIQDVAAATENTTYPYYGIIFRIRD